MLVPANWPICWARASPRCSAGARSALVTEMHLPAQRQPSPSGPTPKRTRTPTDHAEHQHARIHRAAPWPDCACARGSGPVHRLRAQLLPSAPCAWPGQSPWPCPATTGVQPSSRPVSRRSESDVEMGHHLSLHHRARDLAVPLHGARDLEPLGGGLE